LDNYVLANKRLEKVLNKNNEVIFSLVGTTLKGSQDNIDPFSLFKLFYKLDEGKEDLEVSTLEGFLEGFIAMHELKDVMDFLIKLDLDHTLKSYYLGNKHYRGYPLYTEKEAVKNFNNMIIDGNKKIISGKNEKLLNLMIKHANIITPGFTGSPFDTPLSTMGLYNNNTQIDANFEYMSRDDLFIQWMMSSYMLIVEINVLNKAKIYLDNKFSANPLKLSPEFEQAYRCWQIRQYEISPFKKENLSKYYVIDYTSDIVMSREVSEDLLYVQLNLLLAIRMSTELYNKYIQSNKEFELVTFTLDTQEIIDNHISDHSEDYLCLQDIREYQINKLNKELIEFWYDRFLKDDIEYKELKISLLKTLLSSEYTKKYWG